MDIKHKIINALRRAIKVAYVRLEDDDGITGFVVSPSFKGMSSWDRQTLIDKALASLTPNDQRRVLLIAAITPAEYETTGVPVRIQHVKQLEGGTIEIVLYGPPSDAAYVRDTLKSQAGVRTSAPKKVAGAKSELMSFRAKGTSGEPLTRAKTIRALRKDPNIEVLANAGRS